MALFDSKIGLIRIEETKYHRRRRWLHPIRKMVIKKNIVTSLPSRKSSKQAGADLEKSEDILKTLKRVSGPFGVRKVNDLYISKGDTKLVKFRIFGLIAVALVTTAWGIGSLIFTPLQMLLSIRLEMSPGLPPYEWWLQPPDEVLLKVYVFNITNSEAFLNGTDKKLRVQEIGPIIYREKLRHSNPKHNSNGTLTYTANRSAIFLPEMNTVNLNDTITVPNLSVLLIPAYFYDASMFIKLGVNVLLRSYKSQPLVKMTIQDYLWNATDPILGPAKNLAPSLVPTKNVGLLNIVYRDFENNVSVFIGNKHGNSKFFTINTFDGSEFLPHFSELRCQLKFRNASEGLGYPQMISRDANLTYWRKTLCKQADIRYARDDSKYGINAYRFEFVPWAYNRTEWEGNKDCFAGAPVLPNGIADVSPCYWGFPMAVSFPHFLYAEEKTKSYVDGMSPNKEDHGSFVLIEPITGVPLEGKARSQINLIMKKTWGFTKNIQPFSDTFIPLAWLEYHQVGVPWYIKWLVYYVAVIVPITQIPFAILSLSLGGLSVYFLFFHFTGRPNESREALVINKRLKRENQSLIDYDCDA